MIAVDTQILVYATRTDTEWHEAARACVEALGGSGQPWAIPWPCVHEFIRVITARDIFKTPATIEQAFSFVESWLASESLSFLAEGSSHLELLRSLAVKARLTGAAIHDARIVAICIANGVSELWSADRDFSRFPDLKVVNPLVS